MLGAIWNTEVKPPYTIQNGKVYDFSIRTPGGSELHFYDEPKKQKVTLTLPSGTTLIVDDENQAAATAGQEGNNALTMDLKGGNITLQAKTSLTLSAGDTAITLKAAGSMTAKAAKEISVDDRDPLGKGQRPGERPGRQVEVKASGTLDLKASGITTVKGTMVNIN